MTDVDGNQYIDYTLAWGRLILGHRHPSLVAAVREQAGHTSMARSTHWNTRLPR